MKFGKMREFSVKKIVKAVGYHRIKEKACYQLGKNKG